MIGTHIHTHEKYPRSVHVLNTASCSSAAPKATLRAFGAGNHVSRRGQSRKARAARLNYRPRSGAGRRDCGSGPHPLAAGGGHTVARGVQPAVGSRGRRPRAQPGPPSTPPFRETPHRGDPLGPWARPAPGAPGSRARSGALPPSRRPLTPRSRGCPTAPSRACPSRLAQRRGSGARTPRRRLAAHTQIAVPVRTRPPAARRSPPYYIAGGRDRDVASYRPPPRAANPGSEPLKGATRRPRRSRGVHRRRAGLRGRRLCLLRAVLPRPRPCLPSSGRPLRQRGPAARTLIFLGSLRAARPRQQCLPEPEVVPSRAEFPTVPSPAERCACSPRPRGRAEDPGEGGAAAAGLASVGLCARRPWEGSGGPRGPGPRTIRGELSASAQPPLLYGFERRDQRSRRCRALADFPREHPPHPASQEFPVSCLLLDPHRPQHPLASSSR
ncbi:uncharacterized protein [Manis javanica]|uniref:uncharacterized protein n=1 Tax=Manis javanica TaxID=9974 RepID=UPI003C6DA356